jgi:hypothetical protein
MQGVRAIMYSILYLACEFHRRKIRQKESNAKCHSLTKLTCKGTSRKVFGVYLSETPSPPRFWFGVV